MIPSRGRLEAALVPGERLELVEYGRLVGEAVRENVAVAVTDRRLVCLSGDGDRLVVDYASIASIRSYTHSRLTFDGVDSRLLAAGFGLVAGLSLLSALSLARPMNPAIGGDAVVALVLVAVVSSLVAIKSAVRVMRASGSGRSRRETRLARWYRTGRIADARWGARRAIRGGWIRSKDRTRGSYWRLVRVASSQSLSLRRRTRRLYWRSRTALQSAACRLRLASERVHRRVSGGTSSYRERLADSLHRGERTGLDERASLGRRRSPGDRTEFDDGSDAGDRASSDDPRGTGPERASTDRTHAGNAETGPRRGRSLIRAVGRSGLEGYRSLRPYLHATAAIAVTGFRVARSGAATGARAIRWGVRWSLRSIRWGVGTSWRAARSAVAVARRSWLLATAKRVVANGVHLLVDWRRWLAPVSGTVAVASLAAIARLDGGVLVVGSTALAVGATVAAAAAYRSDSTHRGIAISRTRERELSIYTVDGDAIHLVFESGTDVDSELGRLAAAVPTVGEADRTDVGTTVDPSVGE